ncbi:MAG TPA: hypothetical protein VFM82_03365 [Flavobacteriaceae bacterium]|nr:hypothetical protein [Flavobacteriaceae bacterium]
MTIDLLSKLVTLNSFQGLSRQTPIRDAETRDAETSSSFKSWSRERRRAKRKDLFPAKDAKSFGTNLSVHVYRFQNAH